MSFTHCGHRLSRGGLGLGMTSILRGWGMSAFTQGVTTGLN